MECPRRKIHESFLDCINHQMDSIRDPELPEDRSETVSDRRFADEDGSGDLVVAKALTDQRDDLPFSRSECVESADAATTAGRRRGAETAEHARDPGAVQPHLAGMHPFYRLDENFRRLLLRDDSQHSALNGAGTGAGVGRARQHDHARARNAGFAHVGDDVGVCCAIQINDRDWVMGGCQMADQIAGTFLFGNNPEAGLAVDQHAQSSAGHPFVSHEDDANRFVDHFRIGCC